MKLPREWTQQSVNRESSRGITARFNKYKKLTAKIDMSDEVAGQGLCPECREKMQPVLANGVQCLCCMNCRIVLPQKASSDDTEESQES